MEEAERRGLPNLKIGIDSVDSLITDKAICLFESFGVYTKAELESRAEIEYESYAKTINIEAKTMIDMVGKQIIPAVIRYTTNLAASLGSGFRAHARRQTAAHRKSFCWKRLICWLT